MKPRWPTQLALVGGMACLLLAAGFAVQVIRADWAYFQAEKSAAVFRQIHAREDGDPRADLYLRDASASVAHALALWPTNPAYLRLAAQLHAWQGFLAAAPADTRQTARYYRQAAQLLRQALRTNPAHAETWALLAEYKTRAGERDAEWHQAREKALELGGANQAIVRRMLSL